MRVPSKKAAAMPERERPVIKIGEPRTKITALDKMADCQEVGFDATRLIARERVPSRSLGDALTVRIWDIFVGLRDEVWVF